MGKRIIIVGPSASGKNFLRGIFVSRGFKADVSYTTREQREGEVQGVDYVFLSKDNFKAKQKLSGFYEFIEYKKNLYGTGLKEWEERDIFIMETSGIAKIKPEDRESCFIIYLDPPRDSRIKRMVVEREWKWEEVIKRLDFDEKCFKNFKDYDIRITDAYF